jgi:hypothetical protein
MWEGSNKKTWSYLVCKFVAELGERMNAPVFDMRYQHALLGRQHALVADEALTYLWSVTFDVEQICTLAKDFWRNRVTSIVGTDPRDSHCPHRELTEYVARTGVPNRTEHLHVAVDRATCTCYMRFRLNQWSLNSVLNARYGADKPKHCLRCDNGPIEDRIHMLFECQSYECVRRRFDNLFASRAAQSKDMAAWLRDNDQAAIAHCLTELFSIRFAS